MQTYRKKPVTISAVRLTEKNIDAIWEEHRDNLHSIVPSQGLVVKAPAGNIPAYFGDWIIRNIAGEFFVLSHLTFTQTYDPV